MKKILAILLILGISLPSAYAELSYQTKSEIHMKLFDFYDRYFSGTGEYEQKNYTRIISKLDNLQNSNHNLNQEILNYISSHIRKELINFSTADPCAQILKAYGSCDGEEYGYQYNSTLNICEYKTSSGCEGHIPFTSKKSCILQCIQKDLLK